MADACSDCLGEQEINLFLEQLSKECIDNDDDAYKIGGKLGVDHSVIKKV